MNMPADSTQRLERNPDRTRRLILEAAFNQIYRHGYQGTRLDDVVAATGLTKGALYHHFPNKQALGYAVVDEIIRGMVQQMWLQPLQDNQDPLGRLVHSIEHMDSAFGEDIITYGCPLNNLALEMSPLDEGFRTRLDEAYQLWRCGIQDTLQRAQMLGQIRADLDCAHIATFVLAALSGCIGVAKNARSVDQLGICGAGLIDYLHSLQPRVN